MKTRKWLSIAVTLIMVFAMSTSVFAASDKLIINGDFEAGNTGFQTDYKYLDPSQTGVWTLGPEFMYTISTNPSQYHSYWGPGFGDHTTGTGSMMIVNGTPTATEPKALVWGQIVNLPGVPDNALSNEISFDLFAGQNMLVGKVLVKNSLSKVCVKFVLNEDAISEGWLITETHVALADTPAGIPQKNGNPIPGQFPVKETLDPGMTEAGWYCLEIGTDWVTPNAIAAHAVVQKQDCVVNALAPYGPSEVIDKIQGVRYDGTPVKLVRSNPNAALVYEETKLETDFYSLGFGKGLSDYAFLTVRFDTPVLNGPGPDLQIVEDTWGLPYPIESCDVYASTDGADWTLLGSANNQTPLPDGVHTFTNFDLGLLASASYIKVVDTSTPSDFAGLAGSQGATLDGFDVNAILALQDNRTCTYYSETAWGGDKDFSGKNWATYIDYTCQTPVVRYMLGAAE